jgi:hypothetical protein
MDKITSRTFPAVRRDAEDCAVKVIHRLILPATGREHPGAA